MLRQVSLLTVSFALVSCASPNKSTHTINQPTHASIHHAKVQPQFKQLHWHCLVSDGVNNWNGIANTLIEAQKIAKTQCQSHANAICRYKGCVQRSNKLRKS
jgi:hypothetical protein